MERGQALDWADKLSATHAHGPQSVDGCRSFGIGGRSFSHLIPRLPARTMN
jgi:hypothetical protein